MTTSHGWLCTAIALALNAPLTAPAAYGQAVSSPEGDFIEELIVTAQKRSTPLQDVPMSITAFSSENLERAGITEFRDYAAHVPNIAYSYSNSVSASSQTIAIRGVFGANTTGVYLDEVPLQASVDPRIADIERIEVLRGPQGTLYGARSMGGTIRLISRQPDVNTWRGHAHAITSHTDEGDWNGSADFGLNVPLIEGVLAVRANGFYDYQSGIFDRVASADAPVNFGTDENVDSARHFGGQLAARAELLDGSLAVTPRIAFERGETDGRPYADVRPGNFVHSRMFDVDEKGTNDWELYTLTAQYDAAFGSFVSSTSQFERQYDDTEDFAEFSSFALRVPPSLSIIRANADYSAFAQELRFTSSFQGPLQLTAGVFFQSTDNVSRFPPTAVGDVFENIFSQRLRTEVDETALFGELTYAITDRWRVTAGARWFDNKVDFSGEQDGALVAADTFRGTQKETGTNPKYQTEFDITDDVLAYAAASKGFRIGGVNSFSNLLCAPDLAALGLGAGEVLTFDSDSLWSYEIGAKTSWLQRRLTVNGAAYQIEWDDLQQLVPLPTCGFNLTLNAGSAEIRGFEMELNYRATGDLTLLAGIGRADSEITSSGGIGGSVQVGRPIQQVPEWTYSAGLDYDFTLGSRKAFLNASYSYVDDSDSANNDSVNRRLRPAYDLTNVRAGVWFQDWQVVLFVENVFNEDANLSDVPPLAIEMPGRPRIAVYRPRTLGIEARVTF